MGIHGLTGFIDRNQHLLHFHQLHDCSVVIDGNNFYHFLYYACHVQCSFGGDYDIYRDKIIATFQSFRRCGITPYIVLDGAYTVDGRKLKTSLSRANARIRLIDVMSNHQRGQALPALAYETFMQTLTELSIPHVTCQFEADNEIAVLANKLKCPVISNDSDFYIFDLSHGFLPLDYLDFRVLHQQAQDGNASYAYLHCHKYNVDDFINSFDGLSRSVLPVFASMLGNDFISASAFQTLFAKVKVPKVVSKKFSLPPRLSKVISVLHWLNTHSDDSDFSDIKYGLLSFIKPERKDKVEQMFVTSVNGYVDVEHFQGFDLFKYFTLGSENCPVTVAEDFKGYNGAIFPEWFVRAVCCGDITPSILNSAILHRVIFLAQVEDLSLPTSFSCSADVRAVIYGILLKEDQPVMNEASSVEEPEKTENISETKVAISGENFENSCTETEKCSNELSVSEMIPEKKVSCDDKNLCRSDTLKTEKSSECDEKAVASQQISSTNRASIDLENCDRNLDFEDENGSDNGDIMVEEDQNNIDMAEKEEDSQLGVKDEKPVGKLRLKQICVEEYDRLHKNLRKSFVEPIYITGEVMVPGLHEISSMASENRKLILFSALSVDPVFLDQFSDDLQLFVVCIKVWIDKANPRVTVSHLESVLIGLVLLSALQKLGERRGELSKEATDNDTVNKLSQELSKRDTVANSTLEEKENKPDMKETFINLKAVCSNCDIRHLINLKQNLEKYHRKPPSFNHKNHYNPKISHAFAQLQACMVDIINLNKLLRFPLLNSRPSELINGTFLYNMQNELLLRPQPDLFLASMLGKNSPLHYMFQSLRTLIVDYVGQENFTAVPCNEKKSRKRKSKGKCKERGSGAELEDKLSENEESGVSTVPGFDVANKFSVLNIG